MILKEIKSLQHPIVKHLVNIRKDRQSRQEYKSVLISGNKMIEELGEKAVFKTLIIEEGYLNSFPANEVYVVTREILKKITGLANPEGMAAEIALPLPGNLEGKNQILVLDEIADPGNLGTLLRTALALGWDGAFITENSVDPFNDKALRAAKGATFHLPLLQGNWDTLRVFIEKNQLSVFVADKKGIPVKELKIVKPIALILGNESRGVSIKSLYNFTLVSIPIHSSVESLNVASAGAILMSQML